MTPPLDVDRIVLRGQGLVSSRVGEKTEFVIDASQVEAGEPRAVLLSDSTEINVQIQAMTNNTFR